MITIAFNKKTKLIDQLLKQENIQELEKRKLVSKLTLQKKQFADIYFHSGELDKEAISNIQNAKKIICNSFASRQNVLIESKVIDGKVDVLYPSIEIPTQKSKEAKKQFCEEYNIEEETKLILFTAKNIKNYGVKEFIDIVLQLNYKNKKAIIASDKKQIYNLKFQLSKYDLDDKLLLLEDYKDMNKLFLASDIFILPTHTKSFASSILKAMASKTAVFITSNNAATEVVDVFATMENPSDPSAPFKVDALLGRKEDLKLIKKQNKKAVKDFTLENAIGKINKIIESI